MAESFPAMNGGDGTFSYAKNSLLQKQGSDFVKAMIYEAIIGKLDADTSAVVRLADFGCSVGPNTFSTVQNMIDAVEKKAAAPNGGGAEFEVLFNDRISNDFNTLFASLPPRRNYYAAAVPGSFHGRLFPRGSITLAHSSFSVHHLSKLPAEIGDRESRAWNGGRINYTREGDVERAYSDQFGRDMEVFLRSRGEEIVKGGLMFLIVASQGSHSRFYDNIESSIQDLVNEGVMNESEIDGYNLPFYFPSEEEMTKAIEENGCFIIERVELTKPGTRLSARTISIHLRAVLEGRFRQAFGESLMDKIFTKALAKAEKNPKPLETAVFDSVQLFYALKRK